MKKVILSLLVIVGVAGVSLAQDAEIKSAQANITGKKYIAALSDLNLAKKAITELISTELASVLPAKMGKMEMQDQQQGGMQSEGVQVDKLYRKPVEKSENSGSADEAGGSEDGMSADPTMMDSGMGGEQEQISVTITTNMMMASEVMNAHSMSENNMGESGASEAVRVKGYRALLKTYGGGDMGQPATEVAMAIVGGAFVQVEARGLSEKGQAEKFINLIDFDKLKGIVGE